MIKEVYRGLILREEHEVFMPRIFILALSETTDQFEIAKSYSILNSFEGPKKTYFVGLTNNPSTGLVICLNLAVKEMDDKAFVKEAFKCALFRGSSIFGNRLALETVNTRERQWIEHEYLRVLDEGWDELDFALSN